MRIFTRGRRKAAIGISALGAAVAMLVTGGMSYQLVTSTDAALTDTLTFGGVFAPKPKDVKPVGQWSYSEVSLQVENTSKWNTANNSTVPDPATYGAKLPLDFSEQAQSRSESGGACAWGGAGESCNGTAAAEAAADASTAGNILKTSWDPGGVAANAYFWPNTNNPVKTAVKCTADGDTSALEATAPNGIINHGNPHFWTGRQTTFDVGAQASGSEVEFKVASAGYNTYTHVKIAKSHGTDEAQHRAWSEVVLTVWGTNGGDGTGALTYTFRSECGISFNDGSGSKAPRGVTSANDANGFANFLRSFVPWLDDDASAEDKDDKKDDETLAADKDAKASTSEKKTSEKPSEKSTESKTSEKASESKTSVKTSDKKTSSTRDDESESTESSTTRTSEPKSETSTTSPTSETKAPASTTAPSSEPATTEDATTETTEAAAPLPTTAPGSPRSSGFSDASTVTLNGTAYQALATRELGDGDVQTLANVEAAALAAAANHEFTGTAGGASWSYFSGTGIDVIEVTLADGSTAQLRLASHGAALPQPDVAAPTQDDEE
ncbi:hypothetical protein ACFWGD_06560 [Corynebacterium sp. NPDC060344]|uniref:hypothetical protein n=1 Tax=Corynebacterium sp. NPDC060344 TaxID=3347101 RepID=UPI00364BECC2